MLVAKGVIAAFALTVAASAGAQVQYSNAPPGYHGDHYNPRDTVVCESQNGRRNRCGVAWRDARIVQQISSAACVRGRTWGFDRGSIWVDQGCRARFAPVGGGGGWQPGAGWNQRFEVSCGSPQHRYYFCQVDVGRSGRVRLIRQNSHAACIEGRTWGWNRAGIWVDRGCGAQFMVDRRW